MASLVWNHFNRHINHVICEKCQTIISTKVGSTSSIWSHLKLKHNILINKISKLNSDNSLYNTYLNHENKDEPRLLLDPKIPENSIKKFIKIHKRNYLLDKYICKLICKPN